MWNLSLQKRRLWRQMQKKPSPKAIKTPMPTKKKGLPLFFYTPRLWFKIREKCIEIFLTEITDDAPIFGSLAMDFTEEFNQCFTIYNGEYFDDKLFIISAYGNLNPKFYVANIALEKISSQSALVTKSEGHVLMEVNNRHVRDYFESYGLLSASETFSAMSNIPFLIDYNDGTPMVVKSFVNSTPEGYAFFAGSIPEGKEIYVSKINKTDVLETAKQLIDKAMEENPNATTIIAHSCVVRHIALGTEHYGEMEVLMEKTQGKASLLMSCSGGEYCPTQISDGRATNRFHNATLVACVF